MDSVRLGREDNKMAEVITGSFHDMRPDVFLRKLGEGTGIMEAGKEAGIEHDDLVKMLEDDPKFRLTVREIIIDRAEDDLRREVGVLVANIQKTADDAIALLMVKTEEAVMLIHEAKFDGQ